MHKTLYNIIFGEGQCPPLPMPAGAHGEIKAKNSRHNCTVESLPDQTISNMTEQCSYKTITT